MALIQFFESQLQAKLKYPNRIAQYFRFHYGNPITGRAWDEHDAGYLALGTNLSDPIIIALTTPKSSNGNAVLISHLVKIDSRDGSRIFWRHPRFHTHEEDAPDLTETHTDSRQLRRVSIRRSSEDEVDT